MAAHMFYLIRHGHYLSGDGADELGNGLTDLGRQQSEQTAEALKNIPISAIHCSTLRRAVETAAIIAARFPSLTPQANRDLWEFIPTIPPKFADYFAQQLPDVTPETIARDRKVGDVAFDRLFRMPDDAATESHVVIVAHGNLISYYVCRAMGISDDLWIQMETHNCGISRLSMGKSSLAQNIVKLVSFNDFGHLPPELRSV